MRLANPAGLLLLSLAIPVLLLHVLRPQRTELPVSSTYLWRHLPQAVSAARPWQRLRPSWLLFVQLLIVALLALALAKPVDVTESEPSQHTVFVIDTSGSMAAQDGEPDRIASARAEASRLRDGLPNGAITSVVVAGPEPEIALARTSDRGTFDRALAAIRVSNGISDFAGAFALAEGLESPGEPVHFVLLSDGGLADFEKGLLPVGTAYHRVGSEAANRGITSLTVEERNSGLHVRVAVENFGGPAAKQDVRIDVDGHTASRQTVDLAPHSSIEVTDDLPFGDRVEAFLEGEDFLGTDNHAYAVTASRPAIKVLLIGPRDVFLETALQLIPGVTLESSDEPRPAEGFDVAIYDGVPVPEDPGVPFLAIQPPDGMEGVAVHGSVDRPAVVLVQPDDDLVEGLDLSGIAIATAQRLEAAGDRTVVGAEGTPLLISGTRGGLPFAYLGFSLENSNLPVQVAFPVLVDRTLDMLSGNDASTTADRRVGQTLPIPPGVAVQVRSPGGASFELAPGSAAPLSNRAGFWTITGEDASSRIVAVNVPKEESRIAPVRKLPTPQRAPTGSERQPDTERSLLEWVVLALLAALVAEWLLARRRAGVARGQWRLAVAGRAAAAALLLLALVGPTIAHAPSRVATVFVVDGSDSMGDSGRAAAKTWLEQSLRSQPGDAVSGVVVFGGDAKLEATPEHSTAIADRVVEVDGSHTDLERALRLASGVLPADGRRRVVVVSDGRVTDGDAVREADRLRRSGVQLDVHTIRPDDVQDVAVSAVDVPNAIRQGERFTVQATVIATSSGPARVVLERAGDVVEERIVDLEPGPNVVEFEQVAGEPGTSRYRVLVAQNGDRVQANDVGFAAVQVQGPATVLVVEGTAGNAETLSAALGAGGLKVDVVPVAGFPAVDRLAEYASVVLVDVSADALSPVQVAALTSTTRDLGRGLVALGGDRSYALGGYSNTPLEDLLPVYSQVQDPKRKLDVAQVLAIDTSGSMAACHCQEGQVGPNGLPRGGSITQGGVNKTDISKAAAARTIDALNANDEIGLLAFNTTENWIIPLQKLPSDEVVNSGLARLSPAGGTNLSRPLLTAAEELQKSKAKLKHVILFTDGFSSPDSLRTLKAQAEQLANDGVTVSVLATGEVAYDQLEQVAIAGRGRFYAGEDLHEIPQLMMQEALVAARDIVEEGQFLPEVVSFASPVRALTATPPLFGYLATTSKPTANTLLQIGTEHDPLLATWQVGLGHATSWTSDASARWSQGWANWEGYTDFWAGVVKDTFPLEGSTVAVDASVDDNRLHIAVESTEPFPDGVNGVARVSRPDQTTREVRLERTSPTSFAGDIVVSQAGSYPVGVGIGGTNSPLLTASAVATHSYPAEYQIGDPQPRALIELSQKTSGRGEIAAGEAFDAGTLERASTRVRITAWLIAGAAVLWALAIALGQLNLRRQSEPTTESRARHRLRRAPPADAAVE